MTKQKLGFESQRLHYSPERREASFFRALLDKLLAEKDNYPTNLYVDSIAA